MRKTFLALFVVLLAVSLAGLFGCNQIGQDQAGRQDQERQENGQDETRTADLRILNERNEVVRTFTVEQLRDLEEETATVETPDGTETIAGPTLKTVLDEANVTGAERFTVIGATNSATITAEETQTSILDFTDGSIRLAGEDIPSAQWIDNVNQIIVREQVALRVLEDGNLVESYTFDELRQVFDTSVTVEDEGVQRRIVGARLSTILEDAGVAQAERVRVIGENREISLSRDEIQNSALFIDARNRNTIGFASLDVARDRWPTDVTQIEVAR